MVERPRDLIQGHRAGRKGYCYKRVCLVGLLWLNFSANLPFNEIRQVFAPLLKEIPTAFVI